jgi:outer membrane immunogenic protein
MRVSLLVVTSAVCLCGLTHATVAADMPLKAYAPPVVPPAYDWSGLYVGMNAGGAWSNRSLDIAGMPWHDLFSTEFIGGLQLGYNLHAGHFLAGIEGDLD